MASNDLFSKMGFYENIDPKSKFLIKNYPLYPYEKCHIIFNNYEAIGVSYTVNISVDVKIFKKSKKVGIITYKPGRHGTCVLGLQSNRCIPC